MTNGFGSDALGRRQHKWLRGLRVQARVIHALMLREAVGLHGHHSFGFFWVIVEPLALMAGITFLWSVTKMSHGHDIDIVPFALTGYSFLTLWRHITNKSVRSISRSAILSYHLCIKPIDVMISRATLETLALLSAFVVSYTPLALLGYCPFVYDTFDIVGGFALTGLFSFGFALNIAAITQISKSIGNIMPAFMYITLPITGAFTMQEWIPESARYFLSWSPLVNCIEMIRAGVFGPNVPTHFDMIYTLECSAALIVTGLQLCRLAERYMDD